MDKMEGLLGRMREGGGSHADFRLFITALPHPKFPLGLLQMSTKARGGRGREGGVCSLAHAARAYGAPRERPAPLSRPSNPLPSLSSHSPPQVTNEPPAGLRAGLLRSYNTIVDQDRLERIDAPAWRQLVYALCFLHSVVQVREGGGGRGWLAGMEGVLAAVDEPPLPN